MYKGGRVHHNSQKRFYGEGKIYFITTVTDQRFPFFKEDLFCELFIENLKICKKIKDFDLYGFIIIPNHVHLLLAPIGNFNISKIMHAIKRHFSRNINLIMDHDNLIFKQNNCISTNNEGEDCNPRLHLDAHNFNKKIIEYRKQFINKYGDPQHDIPKFKWQKSFYDHVIRNEKDFKKYLNYITLNSVKHGYYENANEYKWSCLNNKFINLIDL